MPNLKKLKNGVTVLTDYVSSVETVCVGMWVYVGARNETKENNADDSGVVASVENADAPQEQEEVQPEAETQEATT